MKSTTVISTNVKVISSTTCDRQVFGHYAAQVAAIILSVIVMGTSAHVSADVGRGAASGAAMGGFMGLVFGDDLGDVIEGAAVGAGAGAIGGAVSGSMKQKETEKRAQQQRDQELRRLQEENKQLQQQSAKTQQAANNQQNQVQALSAAIGEDNFRGLIALVDCEHERAQALAKAGAASNNPDHKLSSIWLQALIANDLRQTDRTVQLYQQLITVDGDIDTEQQASLEADKVLMDVRKERRDKGVSCN